MKHFVLIVAFLANFHSLFSQENFVAFFRDAITNGVPVFTDDSCHTSFTVIKEDCEKENWHDLEILEKSGNRFKVLITSPYENNFEPVTGWIEREQCGVFLKGRYITPGQFDVRLYKEVGANVPFLTLSSTYGDDYSSFDDNKAVPVLDIDERCGQFWIKTALRIEGKIVECWIIDYCPFIYNSCT